MNNLIKWRRKRYLPQDIKRISIAKTASLSGRVLDVDSAEVELRSYTDLSGWSSANILEINRDGSAFARFYPTGLSQLTSTLYSVSCLSELGYLSTMPHKGGVYNGSTTFGALVREICGYENGSPTMLAVFIDSAFENIKLYGWLPYVSPGGENGARTGSAKDNLLQVLFAACAYMRVAEDGTLRIENLSSAESFSLDAGRVYLSNASVFTDRPVTSVTVLEHSYIAGSASKTLFDGTAYAGQVVVFDEPVDPASLAVASSGTFSITERHANYCVLSVGSGTLTGNPYIHTTFERTQAVTAADALNPVRITEATLIAENNSGAVLDRLAAYYACRTWINADVTVDFERPGDVGLMYNPFTKTMQHVCIEKMSLMMSNTIKGTVSALVGYTPYQTQQFDDEYVLIDQAWIAEHGNTYTFPANLKDGTKVTLILIGGGDGGARGSSGDNGSGAAVQSVFISSNETKTLSQQAQDGGDGGKGGARGAGGKIFRGEIIVNHSQSFNVSIGSGGAKNGGSGGDTTFGTLTSASGASSESGYYDNYTQTRYALPGTAGAAGEKGERGASGTLPSPITLSVGGNGGSSGSTSGGSGTRVNTYGPAPYPATAGYTQWDSIGGMGADATAKTAKTVYGCGGDGGTGGGGGGGCGGGSWTEHYTGDGIAQLRLTGTGGRFGTGGDGGAGAPGCAIAIYRVPVQGGT